MVTNPSSHWGHFRVLLWCWRWWLMRVVLLKKPWQRLQKISFFSEWSRVNTQWTMRLKKVGKTSVHSRQSRGPWRCLWSTSRADGFSPSSDPWVIKWLIFCLDSLVSSRKLIWKSLQWRQVRIPFWTVTDRVKIASASLFLLFSIPSLWEDAKPPNRRWRSKETLDGFL